MSNTFDMVRTGLHVQPALTRWFATASVTLALCATVPLGYAQTTASEEGGPATELTQDVLYKLLVAEFAGRRGQLGIALDHYLEAVRDTQSPEIAERAVRMAVFGRDQNRGIEAAKLWTEVAPDSAEARQVHAVLLLREGKVDDAIAELMPLIEGDDKIDDAFTAIGDMLARERDKSAAVDVMERLLKGHDDDPEAQFAMAQLLSRSGQMERSRVVLERVLRLDPAHEPAAVVYARMLQRSGDPDAALSSMRAFLDANADANSVRMTYARMLVDAKQYDDAQDQFRLLDEKVPDDPDVIYALALLQLQTEQLDEAQGQFERLIELRQRRQAAYYYLGQIAESRKEFSTAVKHYRRVDRGEHHLNAQIRVAVMLAEDDDVEAAREHLHGLRGNNTQESVRIYRAEAEILSTRDRFDDALQVYNNALEQLEDNSDLLYGRAMLAEKMEQLDIVEADLRKILEAEPDNADALNALGYTLADRTTRYEEALELIQRALELKPDDHYIVDSMGWVLYRLGRHEEALTHLRRALEIKGDPEIAAHLGEVLWVMGDREGAKRVWDDALQSTPDDERLLGVIKRFGP